METIKINNNIKEDEVPLYNPQGKLIGIIKNELAFNDVRIQIKSILLLPIRHMIYIEVYF